MVESHKMKTIILCVCCFVTVSAQWDCANFQNPNEYYGDASEYCTRSQCGFPCSSSSSSTSSSSTSSTYWFTSEGTWSSWPLETSSPSDTSPENSTGICTISSGNILPTCADGYSMDLECDVPLCNEHAGCYYPDTRGIDYRGLARYTQSGFSCINWDDIDLAAWNVTDYHESDLVDNYCRNPSIRERPWCLYTDRQGETRWDYCLIPECNSTLLAEFIRVPNQYNTNVPSGGSLIWRLHYFDEHFPDMEERCARICVEETDYTCRQFHVAFYTRYCEWLEYGMYYAGEAVNYRYDTYGDTFLRKSTYCEGLQRDLYPDACFLPLGMESRWIADDNITATSYKDKEHAPYQARLYGNSSWIPHPNDTEPAIKVSFGERMIIWGLLIEGEIEANDLVTFQFSVKYRVEGADHIVSYQQELFQGTATSCVTQQYFRTPIYTHEIQIWPDTSNQIVALRLEFLGCRDNDCDVSSGISNKAVHNNRITASSFLDIQHLPTDARLNPFRRGGRGWIPTDSAVADPQPWWQVSFAERRTVAGIMTRKCENSDGKQGWLLRFDIAWALPEDTNLTQENEQRVTNLTLQYAQGSSLSRRYLDTLISETKIVRIYPKEWGGEYQCLTLELIGCEFSECRDRLQQNENQLNCLNCDSSTLHRWRLHEYARDGSSGIWLTINGESRAEPSWVQVDFDNHHILTGIISQGGTPDNFPFDEAANFQVAVDKFIITYHSELEGEDPTFVEVTRSDGSLMVFSGLTNVFLLKTTYFERPITATSMRIVLLPDDQTIARIRFNLLGCQLTDPEQICISRELIYSGYCLGTIQTDEVDACGTTFLPNSYAVAIKSQDIQDFILRKRTLITATSSELVIGLKSGSDRNFRWPDGTPLLYDNFADTSTDNYAEYCVFINILNCFQWEAYDCSQSNRATLCQADLNECSAPNHGCSHTCVNDDGGYHCTCPPGLRLQGNSLCVDVCRNATANETLIHNAGGTCMYEQVVAVPWEEARGTCTATRRRLPSEDEFFQQFSDFVQWIEKFNVSSGDTQVEMSTLCPAVNVSQEGDVDVLLQNCSDNLIFTCIEDVSYIKIQDLINEVKEVKLTESYGYIELRGYGPFFLTGSKFHVEITVDKELRVRLEILFVILRRQNANICQDKLSIWDLVEVASRPDICGHLPGFSLILSHRVTLEIELGPLEATMPAMLGFALTYDAVDCNQTICISGCGSTSLVYESGLLKTSPFPATFQPFSHCQTTISAQEGKYIGLQFINYEISVNPQGECNDMVSFKSDTLGSELTFDCVNTVSSLWITKSTTLSVVMSVGLETRSKGFVADITYYDKPGCPESSLDMCASSPYQCTGDSGIILSPNFPLVSSAKCTWNILTPAKSFVQLRFTNFSSSAAEPCAAASVKLLEETADGLVTIEEYCGNKPPSLTPIESSLNAVRIELKDNIGALVMMIEYKAHYFKSSLLQNKSSEEHCAALESGNDGSWEYFNGACYRYVKSPKIITWEGAERYCQASVKGGHLVSIRNVHEANFVHYKMTSEWASVDSRTYIGLGSKSFTGIFRWTDGSPMTYTDWYIPASLSNGVRTINQPDGGMLDGCVEISLTSIRTSALWHDIPCLAAKNDQFICKVDATMSDTPLLTAAELRYQGPASSPECPATMLRCGTGECVHRVYLCDKQMDCSDGSDESACPDDLGACPQTSFTCHDGACISSSFYCDNKIDCADESDELNCAPYNCSEFRCDNGRCISGSLTCDLVDNCFDKSDERNCANAEGQFYCYNGDRHPPSVKCDGIVDCIGSAIEDEPASCENRNVSYKCRSGDEVECLNGACADAKSRCLYDVNQSGYIAGCRDVSHLRDCDNFQCMEFTFKCPSSYCIPLRFRCNDVWDCPSGEDERDCDRFRCPEGTYTCRNSVICISTNEICDGFPHCPETDDELFCGVTCPPGCNCSGLAFFCESTDTSGSNEFRFSPSTKKIIISSVPLILKTTSSGLEGSSTTSKLMAENTSTTVSSAAFWPADYQFLGELELKDTSIRIIPAAAFSGNPNLYSLSLTENPIETIEDGAFADLTALRILDIRKSPIPSNDHIRTGLQQIPSLQTIYADSFAFCCIAGLPHDDGDESTGCHAPRDQFSSCANLLQDNTLRIFMWILGLSALAGNIFVIGLRLHRRQKVEASRIQSRLIFHLAISDLLMGCYMMMIAGADIYYRGDYAINANAWRGSAVCSIAGFLSALSSEVSVFLIMLISLDRILCIAFPLHRNIQLSNKSSRIWLAVVWVFAFVISAIPALPIDYFGQFYGRSSVCLGLPLTIDRPPGWEYSITIFLGLNFVCFTVTAICYIVIFVTVHRSVIRFKNIKDHAKHVRKGMRLQVRVATKMALIVGTDFICWMPIIIMAFLSAIQAVEIPADVYAWTAVFILPLNSSLNPYLYTVSSVWQREMIRRKSKKMLKASDSPGDTAMTSHAVSSLTRQPSQRSQELHKILTSKCILTPFNLPTDDAPIIQLSRYIEETGKAPSSKTMSLILRDVRKAVIYLRARTASGWSASEDRIAVKLDDNGEITGAFLVNFDPTIAKMLAGQKRPSNEDVHRQMAEQITREVAEAVNGTA